jgi:Uma2 family endonuclease
VVLDTYLNTSYRPECELIDGELPERNVGEFDHSRLLTLLGASLVVPEKHSGITTAIAPRVRVKSARIRVPDLIAVTELPTGPIVTNPPFLCIEVVSPRDRMTEILERVDDYLSFGVRYVWLIQSDTRRAFVYTSGDMHEAKDGVLSTENPEIRVALAEL